MLPKRPALRYHGGKWRIASWIISFFPPHICYVEPYGGGGSVLLRKPPSYLEVYNDADGEVCNFFEVLRNRTSELIRAITLTPFARSTVAEAYESATDPLERARRFYVRAWQVRGGPRTQWKSGWRYQKTNARGKRAVDDWNDTDDLWLVVSRLKQVQIENDSALKIIKRYDAPTTLFYLDPPYLPDTRSERWGKKAYSHEMTEEEHAELARAIKSAQGMFVISTYPNQLYDNWYSNWERVETKTRTDGSFTRIEILYLSPAVMRARLPLFDQ
jgi:DNA adenine methylase